MYVPKDLVFLILSYLNYEDVCGINLDYELFEGYIKKVTNKNNRCWMKGIYNNSKNTCFNCCKYLNKKFITIICMNCELDIDKNFSFPIICISCNQLNNNRKMFSKECICCSNRVVHLITNKFN